MKHNWRQRQRRTRFRWRIYELDQGGARRGRACAPRANPPAALPCVRSRRGLPLPAGLLLLCSNYGHRPQQELTPALLNTSRNDLLSVTPNHCAAYSALRNWLESSLLQCIFSILTWFLPTRPSQCISIGTSLWGTPPPPSISQWQSYLNRFWGEPCTITWWFVKWQAHPPDCIAT